MEQQVDVSTMTLVELKALAYDQIAQKEQAELNLRMLNGEIAKRLQAEAAGGPEWAVPETGGTEAAPVHLVP